MGLPCEDEYYDTHPKKETNMSHNLEQLANQITRRANGIFAGTEHETYSYSAAAELQRDHGIHDFNVIPGRTLDTVDQVIRDNTSFPEDTDWDNDEDYVEWSEGDIVDGPTGLGIVLPAGEVWHLSDEKALSLMRGLSTMICHRLTQPWSADDESTILSRGTREVN